MFVFLFLIASANETGIGFRAQQNQTHHRLVSPTKLVQLPCYSSDLSIRLNQEEVDIPEPQQRSGCFFVNWGVPRWAVQGSAAFAGGHLVPWAVFGTIGFFTSGFEPYALLVPPLLLFSDFDGSYWFQKTYLVTWYYIGVPIGVTLSTMGSGTLLNPGGGWTETIRGVLIGDMASFFLAAGYYIVFGNPWAYGAEGGHPTQETIGPFVNIFLPIVSTLPAVGAVIGYTKSLSESRTIGHENMGYGQMRMEHIGEGFASSWCDRNTSLRIPLVKVVF